MALPLDDTRKLVLHNRIERFFLPYQDSALADELVEGKWCWEQDSNLRQ